ncbi:hypothetical protein BCR33DRAFT_850359 [Rhizoclosmatium globosum]|uniref:Pirin N-terminal domain-containing protein n=1 Tax=Rhizoclosmatium globosum TaxID=329046 RepID=A0A1Y2CCV4_9FUNG|nr:hypothetical protein BCR33DRAFT_850359 [Rhizoclosmatium globosum]|eukprot:ORY44863.1 hypothetical protein BCR33DRAFT_850359 [Rhizoclosmatium globosum]
MSSLRSIIRSVKPRPFAPNVSRLIGPNHDGKVLKPFVYLDYFRGIMPKEPISFDYHPHSGLATLSYQKTFPMSYTDTEGKEGGTEGTLSTGFQLWISLPPGVEDGESMSQFIEPADVPVVENVKVLLGKYKGGKSAIVDGYAQCMTCLDVTVEKGTTFKYVFEEGQSTAWALPYEGKECKINGETVVFDHLVIFDKVGESITQTDLYTGMYSVHTNKESLDKGQKRILEIGERLLAEGKIHEQVNLFGPVKRKST